MNNKTEIQAFKKPPFITRFMVELPFWLAISMLSFVVLGSILGKSLPHITETWRMQRWAQTSCQIEAANLVGDETFHAEARYRYTYQGHTYQGSRVNPVARSDNISRYHELHVAKLLQTMEQNQPVFCLVNPKNPDESVLFAEVYWAALTFENLIVVPFSSALFWLGVPLFVSISSRRKISSLHQRFPDQPWKWRLEWQDGRIAPSREYPQVWQDGRITPSREYPLLWFSLACWNLMLLVPPFIGSMIQAPPVAPVIVVVLVAILVVTCSARSNWRHLRGGADATRATPDAASPVVSPRRDLRSRYALGDLEASIHFNQYLRQSAEY